MRTVAEEFLDNKLAQKQMGPLNHSQQIVDLCYLYASSVLQNFETLCKPSDSGVIHSTSLLQVLVHI